MDIEDALQKLISYSEYVEYYSSSGLHTDKERQAYWIEKRDKIHQEIIDFVMNILWAGELE